MQTGSSHFVAISAKTGNLTGEFRLNDKDHELACKYVRSNIAALKPDEVESYYDMVAKDYEKAMSNWGYCMPEILSSAVIVNGGITPSPNIKVRNY